VPQAPTIGAVTGANAQASVEFTAGATGGSTITGYTVTSSPGNITGTGSSSPIVVTGLTNDTAYTFTVTATNANGTSLASSASSPITLVTDYGVMFPIAMVNVGIAGAANITFSSIPNTYTHLQLRTMSRSNASGANDAGGMNTRFNSDSTNSYSFHWILGSGSGSPSTTNGSSSDSFVMGFTNSSNYPAANFTVSIVDIIDYKNTSKNKTVRALGGNDGNGAGFVWLNSGLWQKTDAINSITITPWSGSFTQYSQVALYGIKG
jgi:hypothetical protein